jgi:hypothetical protein
MKLENQVLMTIILVNLKLDTTEASLVIGIEKKLSIFDDPKLSNNTSVSLEYNMMNFNKKTSGSDSSGDDGQLAPLDSQYSVKPKINNLMLTINYRFSDNTLGLKNLIK